MTAAFFAFRIALATAAFTLAQPLVAQTSVEVDRPADIVYRPFQTLPDGETMTIRIANLAQAAINARVEVVPSDGGLLIWPTGEPLAARIIGDNLETRGPSVVARATIPAEGSRDIELRWGLEERRFAEPGQYAIPVDVIVFDDTTEEELSRVEDIPIVLSVAADTAMSIAGTSGRIDAARTFAFIDFGELETGESQFIVFGARANTPVEFVLSSENDGKMAELERPEQTIDYEAVFDGVALDLAGAITVPRQPASDLGGSDYRLDLTVGDMTGAFSGTYRDIITVELVAQ
ncbi:MAG: hypothetical protein WA948_08395 [Pontixanthobacter sp.]